jgi:hypothetical protein
MTENKKKTREGESIHIADLENNADHFRPEECTGITSKIHESVHCYGQTA